MNISIFMRDKLHNDLNFKYIKTHMPSLPNFLEVSRFKQRSPSLTILVDLLLVSIETLFFFCLPSFQHQNCLLFMSPY